MKKGAIVVIIFSLLILIAVVVYKFNSLKLEPKEIESALIKKKSNIPLFEFTSIEGTTFSKYDLQKNRATILVYFDPSCSLCEKSALLFYKFQKLHNTSQVLFVSTSNIEQIKTYIKKFNLENVSNIKFYTTSFDSFYNIFKETNTPTYILYNKDGEHIKTINEEVPARIILRYIKAAQAND